jgi:hypothetical protein
MHSQISKQFEIEDSAAILPEKRSLPTTFSRLKSRENFAPERGRLPHYPTQTTIFSTKGDFSSK